MRQVSQRLRDGRVEVVEVPAPALAPDGVLVDVRASVLSVGTERQKVRTGRQSLLAKARSRPEEVRRVVEKAQRDGVRETVRAVRLRLDAPSALGYSAAGVVVAVGQRVRDIALGERVACGGGEHAVHADVIYVPGNLCVPVPPSVSFDEAAFTTVGSVALHGVRQADVHVGERVGVIGLGLVGQLVGQILRAAGCWVLGVDRSTEAVERASGLGAVDVALARDALESNRGGRMVGHCDAVVIAAATQSDDPVRVAAELLRDRGRVVVVGDVRMDLPRESYYGKELELRLSRSYGPGRYDRAYEERGLDYPEGYVRWTERRNMGAFVDMVATGRVNVADLITRRIPVDQAAQAYEALASSDASPLGVVLRYDATQLSPVDAPRRPSPRPSAGSSGVGVIGAGSFAQRILIPGLQSAGFPLVTVASAKGLSARSAAERFGFARADSVDAVVEDPDVGLVAIASRHDSHAELATRALHAGKAVFVEKPPCLTVGELESLRHAEGAAGRPLTVGFNRRHAPMAQRLREHVGGGEGPVEVLYRVNAGSLPDDHWLNDPDEGGGRLLGEGCHFVDFVCWLVGETPRGVSCTPRGEPGSPLAAAQSFSIIMDFADGSLGTVVYQAAGAGGLGKEYIEAHGGGRSAVIDDFKELVLHAGGRPRRMRARSPDKGHSAQFVSLRRRLGRDGADGQPSALASMATTFAALASAQTGRRVSPAEVCADGPRRT